MTATRPIEQIDISNSRFKANPFPYYARLRASAPAFRINQGFRNQPTWLVTRYDDVSALLRDERFAKNPANALTPQQLRQAPRIPGMLQPLLKNLLAQDPPDHTRLRTLVHKAFTPRTVEQMRGETEQVAQQLLDGISQRGGTFDLIADYAQPLPTIIIGRILGIPAKDNAKFNRWTEDLVTVGSGGRLSDLAKIPSILRFMRYIRQQIRQRHADPQDDLITALVQAQEQDDRMSEDEVLSMVFLLLTAGHETTQNLIASGTLALLQQRDQWELLRDEPTLIRPAVEELLRFVSPAEMATERYPKEDVAIGGTVIPRGELTLAVVASANRDETQFEHADTLDITRAKNPHLAFGKGIHYCVGAPLARLEGSIALSALTERLPDLQLALPAEQLQWRSTLVVRGLKALPVRA